MTGGTLAIDTLSLGYEAAASFERAQPITRRLTATLARALPDALSAMSDPVVDEDEGYIFVDRLDMQSAIATHWPEERIAGQVAQGIAQALFRQIGRGEALIFRDRAEYVGAYAAAMLDPRGTDRWWFAEFDGLAMLPPSQRLATLLLVEGQTGFAGLARLSPDRRDRLVALMTDADLRRLAERLPEGDGLMTCAPALDAAVAAAWRMTLPSTAHRALAMLVHLVGAGAAQATAPLLERLRLLALLIDTARAGALPSAASDPALTIHRWLAVAAPGTSIRLGADEAAMWLDIIAARAGDTGAPDDAAATDGGWTFTPHGGALILCVVLERVGWWREWQTALTEAGDRAEDASRLAATLALAIAARALDPRSAAAIAGDPALACAFLPDGGVAMPLDRADHRRLAGIMAASPATSGLCADRRGYDGRVRACADALLDAFAARVPGADGATAAWLRRQLLTVHASVAADGMRALLGRPPLDVLLVFSGLKRAAATLPHGRTLALATETGP